MKPVSCPILFLALLLLIFSVAFARENKNEKHVTEEVGGIPFVRPRLAFEIPFPRPRDPCSFCPNNCCGNGCCSSEEEHAEFQKARRVP
ncbi:unnamed protein product [Victoria cruziana]